MAIEEKLCDKVGTVRELTLLGDGVSVGGGCEAAVIARGRFLWVWFGECDELLYGRRFVLNKALCLKESEMGTFQGTEISIL